MNNYILADIKRICRKTTFLGAICAYMGLFLIMVFIYFNPNFTATAYIEKTTTFFSFFPLFVGLFVFLSVYYDDFKSKSMQIAIGYGIPRYKVVLSKVVESILLLFTSIFCVGIIALIVPAVIGLSLAQTQMMELIVTVIVETLRAVGYICIAALPVFFTQNAVNGTILFVLFSSRTVLILSTMILGQDIVVKKAGDLIQYLYTPLLYNIRTVFVQTGSINIMLVVALVVYIVIPVVVSVFLFNKKELEF